MTLLTSKPILEYYSVFVNKIIAIDVIFVYIKSTERGCKMRKVGSNIKNLRKELKMTQAEFAKKMGISRSYLGDLENNRRNPSTDTISKIAEKTGKTVGFFIEGTEFNKPENLTIENRLKNLLNSYNLRVVFSIDFDTEKQIVSILIPDHDEPLIIDYDSFIKQGTDLLKRLKSIQDSLVSDFLDIGTSEIDTEYPWPDEYSDYY